MKRNILKIAILSIIFLAIYYTKSYCVESGTVRMQINRGTAWTNINVSESYAECESLNSATSTLGTTLLKAHLTTDADWSAMAIFSVSQYGGARADNASPTNGNKYGIYDIGSNWTQTTGILNTAKSNSTNYIYGLFNSDGSVKNYVRQWPTTRTDTNFVGFIDTWEWLGGGAGWGNSASLPISMKNGLFRGYIGSSTFTGYSNFVTSGGPYSNVTFRPVIWN